MVERETKILRDKKSRRIIKMDRNKANNDKYTYNIVDTNQQSAEMDYESKLPFWENIWLTNRLDFSLEMTKVPFI